jgi:hypothetical protein
MLLGDEELQAALSGDSRRRGAAWDQLARWTRPARTLRHGTYLVLPVLLFRRFHRCGGPAATSDAFHATWTLPTTELDRVQFSYMLSSDDDDDDDDVWELEPRKESGGRIDRDTGKQE